MLFCWVGSSGLLLSMTLLDQSAHDPGAYKLVVQSAAEVSDLESSPAISMAEYLTRTRQLDLRNTISIYGERGDSRDSLRLLYMNDVALRVWGQMAKKFTVTSSTRRPPRTAVLIFGVPFSD